VVGLTFLWQATNWLITLSALCLIASLYIDIKQSIDELEDKIT